MSDSQRHKPLRNLFEIESVLRSTDGLGIDVIAERTELSTRTVRRYLRALESIGHTIEVDQIGKRKVYRIASALRVPRVGLAELLILAIARRLAGSYESVLISPDIGLLERALRSHADPSVLASLADLEPRIVAADPPIDYRDRAEDVEELITAMLHDHRVEVRHVAVDGGLTSFAFDPYAIILYVGALNFVGYSHHHGGERTLGLDGFIDVSRLRKVHFERPTNLDRGRLIGDGFGLIRGTPIEVRIRCDPSVVRYIRRRRWHSTQTLVETEQGIELRMTVEGTAELESWILSFGRKLEILAPASLRASILRSLEETRALYTES